MINSTFSVVRHYNVRLLKKQMALGSNIGVRIRAMSKQTGAEMMAEEKKPNRKFCVDISRAKERVVCKACEEYGFELVDDITDDCFLAWTRWHVGPEELSQLKPYQKVNFFLNMNIISRKDLMAIIMKRVQKYLPNDFNITPKSWVLPDEYNCFKEDTKLLSSNDKNPTYIVKPKHSSQGEGIWLLKDTNKIKENDELVVQEYIDKPLLIDGYKFDLRLYVLITSCDPLKIFIYRDGLVRMASDPYSQPSNENMNNFYMHLTNTSINMSTNNAKKKSDSENNNLQIRTLKWFYKWLEEQTENHAKVIQDIEDLVIKNFLLANPHVKYAYHKYRKGDAVGGSHCFHLLGVDVLLDADYKPWLLETNLKPSLMDQLVDLKQALVLDVLKVVNIRPSDRLAIPGDEKPCGQENSTDMKQIFPASSNELRQYYSKLQDTCDEASKDHLIEPQVYKNLEILKKQQDALRRNLKKETYEEKCLHVLQVLKNIQIEIFNDKDNVKVNRLLERVKSNWDQHSHYLSDYWLHTLDNDRRNEIIESIRKATIRLFQRVWKTWNLNALCEKPLYEVLNKMLTLFLENEGRVFGTACLQTTSYTLEMFQLSNYNQLTEIEKQCCERIFTVCKEYVIVSYHWADITATEKGFVYGIRCLLPDIIVK